MATARGLPILIVQIEARQRDRLVVGFVPLDPLGRVQRCVLADAALVRIGLYMISLIRTCPETGPDPTRIMAAKARKAVDHMAGYPFAFGIGSVANLLRLLHHVTPVSRACDS